jgi:Fe-S cluster biogenesis protein NfuA
VFKRTTSLGGVESLIEHRRSAEGPSSPVPDDLLRLSIGLEAPDDLIADLEAALETATQTHPTSAPSVPLESASGSVASDAVATTVESVLERSVASLVIARGGEIRLAGVSDGVVTLEVCGSPGAIHPLLRQVDELLRRALPQLTEVRFVGPGTEQASDPHSANLAERVRQVLEEEVNPGVAQHRGRVELADMIDGVAHLRLEGGCQGCSLAAVTVWQGIEPLLREHVPEVVGVIDVTDHQAGRDPFYSPAKR